MNNPWFDNSEWLSVCNDFFSDSALDKKHANDKVAMWKSRNGSLPASVESTWQLTAAKLYDDEIFSGAPDITLSVEQVKLSYATALIRFVNLMTAQLQGRFKLKTVYNCAEQLRIVTWLVDLRHDCTHALMASLPLLRLAAKCSLEWLHTNYWLSMKQEILNLDTSSASIDESAQFLPTDEELTEDIIRSILDDFLKAKTTNSGDIQPSSAALADNNLDLCVDIAGVTVCNVLVKTYFCSSIPPRPTSRKTVKNRKWRSLLKHLSKRGLIGLLIDRLLTSAMSSQHSESCFSSYLAWILYLMDTRNVSLDLVQHYQVTNSVISRCLDNASPATLAILKQVVLYRLDFSDDRKEKLLELFEIYGQGFDSSAQARNEAVHAALEEHTHTVEEILELKQSEENSAEPEIISSEKIDKQTTTAHSRNWSLATDIKNWGEIPFGAPVDGDFTYTSYELETLCGFNAPSS